MILKGETVVEDDYPVHFGYAYVACGGRYPEDGEVVASSFEGTAADLKRFVGAAEIRRCELLKRRRLAGANRMAREGLAP